MAVYRNSSIGSIIDRIYASGQVTGRSGKAHDLRAQIDPKEGRFIADIIAQDQSISRTLEIGCAYGLSSLFICDALTGRNGASHTAIEPFPDKWDHVGAKHIQESGIDYFRMLKEKSEFALPRLLAQCEQDGAESKFDLIFIDGFHTLDHSLVDCFYATRLLRTGGYLVIDDLWLPGVRLVANYLLCYPCFEMHGVVNDHEVPPRKLPPLQLLSRRLRWAFGLLDPEKPFENEAYPLPYLELNPRMLALRKVADDQRNWDWYDDRFRQGGQYKAYYEHYEV